MESWKIGGVGRFTDLNLGLTREEGCGILNQKLAITNLCGESRSSLEI